MTHIIHSTQCLPKMPEPEKNGFIRTLNNTGYMTSTLDLFSQAFVDFAPTQSAPVLDVGAAYGVATLAALAKGAHVIANDLDPRHLEILHHRTPLNQRPQLSLLPGSFPEQTPLPEASLGAVLICRVLHFFAGRQIETVAQILLKFLCPGGRIFIVTETPYLRNFQKFIPLYEERRTKGDPWPGWIQDVKAYAPERGASLPAQMHLLDPEVLQRIFLQTGFEIVRCHTFPRSDFPLDMQFDGRESVGLIAQKI